MGRTVCTGLARSIADLDNDRSACNYFRQQRSMGCKVFVLG